MDYTLYHATMNDLDDFIRLQQDVADEMSSQAQFALDDGNYFSKIVSGKGHVLMVKDVELAVACCMLHFPDVDDEDNLGLDLAFSHEQLRHVSHLEMVFIRPGYQGKGIASLLLDTAISLALEQKRHEILATVHPCNTKSLRVFFSKSFATSGFAYKYGNFPRFILRYHPRNN